MTDILTFEEIRNAGFFVSGIHVRTTNQRNKAQQDIGSLWQRFMSENLAASIPGKLSDDIYCVYTDYEPDHTGWYTTVLGCRVEKPEIESGLFSALVPEGSYRRYKPVGDLPGCVVDTWMKIWEDSPSRSYIADYDVYRAGINCPDGSGVEVYLGVI
ncbi:MAG: effector binding domain-containing protein [Bacteroidetes bacterium]|nr:effector binding domain-containing protein [Bacteroidota bacterium]